MKFTGLTVALSLAGSALSATTTPRPRAPPTEVDCISAAKYVGIHTPGLSYSQGCASIARDCMNKIKSTTYIWSKSSCVAAATCETPSSVVTLARCNGNNPAIADQANTPALSTNIYKNIVGACADQGCPITQQNYIDFIYSSLSAVNSTDYPNVETVINSWWGDMKTWANTGDSIPYQNFNDFLHYSTGA